MTEEMGIFRTFADFGRWWFKQRRLGIDPASFGKPDIKKVKCDMTRKQIDREMRSNRCIGGHFTEEI